MMKLKEKLVLMISITAFFALSGCQTIDVRGQYVSDKDLEQVIAEKPNKDKVSEMIGSPTYIPSFSTNTWYYVQRSFSKRAWFDPKVIDQRIVKITFNKNDKLKNAVILANDYDNNISPRSNYTETYGTEQSGIQKFVKNMGRFNSTTNGRKKSKKK
ncbi:MAG: outer membrane protein assembly factor BamE [Rickettsiaceae bacterium]|nr:outer membrane protein assembly factor BamE [Rickettsiaceae bacterium]